MSGDHESIEELRMKMIFIEDQMKNFGTMRSLANTEYFLTKRIEEKVKKLDDIDQI